MFSRLRSHDRSIARRLAFSLFATVSIVSVVTVAFIYYRETQKGRHELEQRADDIIAYEVSVLEIPLWDLDDRAIEVIGNSISRNDMVAELVIRDYFGRVVYARKKEHLSGSVIRSARILHNAYFVGEAFVSLTKQYYQKENRKLLFSLSLIVLLILTSLTFVSGFLVRTFLRKPLRIINTSIESYASGKYDALGHDQPFVEFKPFNRVLRQMGDKIQEQIQELARAEEKYRSIYENAIEGIFQSSPEGRFLNVNPAMAEILGYDSPEELLLSITDITRQFYVRPEDRERFLRLMDRNNRVIEFETHLYRKDGKIITTATSARTVRDAGGEILYYEGYLVDITQRKRAIEALHQTKEQLALLLESLPIVPFTCRADGDFGITYVSGAIHEITGYSPDRFTSDASFWARQLAEEDAGRILGGLPDLLRDGRYHAEYRFRTADGSCRWFEDTRRLVRSPGGDASHIAGTWRDITEEKRLQNEAAHRLQEMIQTDKMASLGEVVSGVAHEINNPNSFITYNVPLLEETWQVFAPILLEYSEQAPRWRYRNMTMTELCSDMVDIIQSIKIGSDRINRIVTDLKDFVRVDEGLPLAPVNVNQVIEKAQTIFGAQARKSVAKVRMSLSPDLPLVPGHFQKLEQVVTNLVVNALRAIPDRAAGRLSIATRHLPDHSAVVILVEDNGTGIPPDILDRIFEPFFTTRRESGGTGLGLSVSYGLVKDHNGILGVLSRPGKGSRFAVFLPTDPAVPLRLRPAVLCLDGETALTGMLSSRFSEDGDQVMLVVDDPEEVVSTAERRPEIDIILAGLEGLGERRWKLLSEIRSRLPLVTLILHTETPSLMEEKPEEVEGPDALLTRPFPYEELKEIIAAIGRQRL